MPRSRWVALVAALIAALTAVSAAAQGGDVYRLKPGDRVSVSVIEDPGLNATVLVRPDGRVSLPLAGTIAVIDRTLEDVQAAIRASLGREFVEPPTVTVSLVGLGADETVLPQVYVIGQVARPGIVPIETDRTLDVLQALAIVGGPSTFAATRRIQVRRGGPDGEQVFLFDYASVADGAVPRAVIELRDGDVIVVPERGLFE